MNAIREQIKNNPLIVGVVIGFIVGIALGLIFAWQIWPVEWKDASPQHMVYFEQVEYLRMSIEAFGQNGDAAKAQARYKALGANGQKALNEIVQNPGTLPVDLILSYSGVTTGAQALATPVTPGVEGTPMVKATPVPTGGAVGLFSKLWPLLCLLGLVLAAILLYLFLRGRPSSGVVTPAMQAQEAKRQAAWTDYTASGSEPPTAQFMASYKLGDDLFDDSFSIDSASGEFLGECGVGISDTVGVGDPKKVTAFEVWLFDKNDIQTVTKVIMSAHAFNDIATRQRLEAKGEPVLAAPGAETVLETQTLQMVARVVNMGYGGEQSAMPEESYFDSFILELAIWQK